MLPYMYLLGKEVGNRWTGMLAMLLTGIAFWPNILARVALRFILYPAFTAPVLYHLFRGIRTSDRNHFIIAGVFLGIGLHGYTPFRIVPFLVVVVVSLYLLHERSSQARRQVIVWLGLLALIALIVFLPLLRYWLDNPAMFNYRLFSRMTTPEGGLPDSAGLVFLKNLWFGLVMPIWSGGNIWVTTVINHPNLDLVSGAMYVLGMGLMLVRYAQKRNWRDITLLLAVPILMLPSTLVLAYPMENPAPNRAGGALVVIFLIAAIALETLLRGVKETMGDILGKRAAWAIGLVLILVASVQNYGLTFDKFRTQYLGNAWNTSELGAVIENFTLTVGHPDSAWVVAFPHWVDTRLVGINAGYPTKDYAIWPDEIGTTLDYPAPKLFLVKPEDPVALEVLQETYPNGASSLHVSDVLYKDFYIYFVPADEAEGN
jgi:4-amino-4-deoxy-L-arabinose transferase-like glycosyltransferase